MKLRHLPPVLFLFAAALSLPSLSFHRHQVSLRRRSPPSSSQSQRTVDDALLRRLAAVDAGAEYVLAEAAELLANATLSSSTPTSTSNNNAHHHRLLTLHLPSHHSTNATASGKHQPITAYHLRIPHNTTLPDAADDESLLAAFRASLRSFLHLHRHTTRRAATDIAGVMRDIPALLGVHRRFPTCAVVGNSGILLGSSRGAQIDGHDFIIRLNNAPAGGKVFARDVGTKTSLSLAHSTVLRRCTTASPTGGGCAACHPYGRAVPLAMYVSHAAHLLDVIACNATSTPASPFPFLLTDPRLDALCARIAKYYSLRRFVSATGEPAASWTRRRDERPPHFHYSSGLQAVVTALGVCDEVSMFGFGKAAGVKHHYHTGRKKETAVHDYEAECQFYRDLQTRPEIVPFLDEAPPGFRMPPVRQYW